MKRKRAAKSVMAILMAFFMVFGIVPADIYASAAETPEINRSVWIQGRDTQAGGLTDIKYLPDENNEIKIPLAEAAYDASTKTFEGFRFQSDPGTAEAEDTWKIEDSSFGEYEAYLAFDRGSTATAGQPMLYAEETAYNTIKDAVEEEGAYSFSIAFGKADNGGNLTEDEIYGRFTLTFTGDPGGEEPPREIYEAWIQGRDTQMGTLTDDKYMPDENNEIRIPLAQAAYDSSTEAFEGFRLQSEPQTDPAKDVWEISGDIFEGGKDYIGFDSGETATAGQPELLMGEDSYNVIKAAVDEGNEYHIPVEYGEADAAGHPDQDNIYGSFTLVFTESGDVDKPAGPQTVTYKNSQGRTVTIENGDTLTVNTTEDGTFTCGGFSNEAGEVQWGTTWTGESQDKPIWIAQDAGDIYIAGEGTVAAEVIKADTGELLCEFTITAEPPRLEEIRLYLDGTDVTGGSYTVEGHQWKTITIKGRYAGSDEFLELTNTNGMSMSSDVDFITCPSYQVGSFAFEKPGTGKITVSAYGAQASFSATSTYVPIQSVKLELPSEIKMHILMYSMGNGDNYQALKQGSLNKGLTIEPANSSYYTAKWAGSDDSVATYYSTHENGFVAHKAKPLTVTASIDDNGKEKKASADVNFVFEKLVEGISMKDGQTSLTLKEEEDMQLPLVFEPDGEADGEQPSQTAIDWTFSQSGIVKIRQTRGEYDRYASKEFVLTGASEGVVEVTGTPVAAAEGVPPVKFTVTVTAGEMVIPDTRELVKTGLGACSTHYSYMWDHKEWAYSDEWDVIALKRAGKPLDSRAEEKAIQNYKDSIKENIEDGTLAADTKPTTLARVALALESIGTDASSFCGFDFYSALLNSDSMDGGSNESIWALIALDAKRREVPANSKYDREKLIDTILSYQTKDGGFNLDKAEDGGDIDLTGMAIQALSNYQDNEKAAKAIEDACVYLQGRMQSSCDFNGTSESLSQVIVGISSLGRDITDEEYGFVSGKTKNAFVALLNYKDYGGFKHTKEESGVNHMATQQAYLALMSWSRMMNRQNGLYDMTDVESNNYTLPVISVTGLENNQTVNKRHLAVEISADAGDDKIESLQVWCNGEEAAERDGKYAFDLNSGSNELNIRAVSSKGAVAQLTWTLKYAPANYRSAVDDSVEELTIWAEEDLQGNEYNLSQNGLWMTYTRTAEGNGYTLDKILKEIQDGLTFKDAGEWADMVLMLTASGVDVSDIYGVNLWETGSSFLSGLSLQDSIRVLTAANAKSGQNLPDSFSKEEVLAEITPNQDGGFGENGLSNTYDTAGAVIALAREESGETVEKAIDWLAGHQSVDGRFTDTGSHSDTECLTKVLEALCEAGIDFTLDDRFNNAANLYTNLNTLYQEADDGQKELIYRAFAGYQRLYSEKNSVYNMDDTVLVKGLTMSEEAMEQNAADHIKTLDFTVYSPEATKAAYLLIRGNQATQAVYDYLGVLQEAVKEKKIADAEDCFFAALYLKENQADLTNVDGADLLSLLGGMSYTVTDSYGTERENATIPMSYALMTLNLQPEGRETEREDFIERISANKFEGDIWAGAGVGYYAFAQGAAFGAEQASTIMAMMALQGTDEISDPEFLVAYLGGEGTKSYTPRQLDAGYWGDYRVDSNKLTGNLATTANMAVGLSMFGVDLKTDARFQKENGNIMHGIRAFARDGGFSDVPDGAEISLESSIAGYKALLAMRFAQKSLPGVYDVQSERTPDRGALDLKVAEAEKLNKDDYTEDTWNDLESALAQAGNASTQKEINLALEALAKAVRDLKSNNEINVTFRLIGDWKHGKDGAHTKYVNWIKTKSYTVAKEAKVSDVFVQALEDAQLKSTGADKGYVSMIQSPAVFGSVKMSEMTNGALSGWKYMVNGEYPGVGLNEYGLSDGDVIIWRYIDNYMDENDDTQLWKEAEDLEPAEIFTKMLTAAKEETAAYFEADKYEAAQQEAAAGIVADAQKKLDEAADTISMNSILEEAKKNLDGLPTKEELEAERTLADAKEKAKELLGGYKDMSLYMEEQQKELQSILEEALAQAEGAKDIAQLNQIVETAQASMDAVKTAEQLAQEENQAAAEAVINAINKIVEPVTEEQKAVIESARKAYNALTEEQKGLVTNYEKLAAAEKAIDKKPEEEGSVTLTNEKYGISLKGDKLTGSMQLIVTPLDKDSQAVTAMRKEIPSTKAIFRMYEIKLMSDGKETDLQGKASLSIPVGGKYNGKELTLLCYRDNKVEKLSGKVENGTLSAAVSSLGSFSVVVDASAAPGTTDNKTVNNGSTGSGSANGSTSGSKTSGSNTSGSKTSGSNTSGSKTSGAKTGDDTPVELMILLLMASCFAGGAAALKKKKCGR